MGTEAMINNMEWNDYKGFQVNFNLIKSHFNIQNDFKRMYLFILLQNNTKLFWYVNDTLAGSIVTERNLTYVKVFNASHMVPYDVPLATMDMMYRFMGLDHHIVNKFPSRIESEVSYEYI